jgi:hypothetical protein
MNKYATPNATSQWSIFLCIAILFSSCKFQPNTTVQEEEDDMDKLIHQELYMTRDPLLGYVPIERKFAAFNYMKQLQSTARTSALTWQERGPTNVGGRVRAILIDSRDATGNTILAGGVGGGIWRCTNFKTAPQWTPLTDQLPNIAISCIVQDPSNPTTIYAGTGEGWFNVDAIRGNGIIKSIDGGLSWSFIPSTQYPATDNFDYVQDIVVTSTGVLYATARSFRFCNAGGVLRSTDGGASWTRVIGSFPTGGSSCTEALHFRGADLEIAANGDLYATTGFQSSAAGNLGKIWKSSASLGASQGTAGNWTDVTPTGNWRRIEVATAPSNANVVYALLQAGANNAIGSIQRSDNGGATWTSLPLPLWCDQGATSTDFTRTQAWYDLIARVDPNNSSVCYIGGVDILKTVDAGLNWTQVTQWASGCSGLPQIHADIHEILFFNSSSSEIVSGTDGGIYYTPNAGSTWANQNNGFRITQFYSVDYHPVQLNYLLGGTQDNGTQRLTQPGLNASTQVSGGDGAFCHIDETDGVIQVTSITGNNYRYSRNSGLSFSVVSGGSSATGRFVNPSDYDDVLDVVYTAHNADLYGLITGLAGTGTPTLTSVSIPTALSGRQISAVKVDPNVAGGGTVWMAGSTPDNGTTSVVPVICKLSNANTATPTVIFSTTIALTSGSLTAGSYVSSVDVERGNSNHLLATISNYGVPSVIESTDGGVTWANVETNLPDIPVRWAIFAPSNAELNGSTAGNGGVIAATELGVWTTSNLNGVFTFWTPNNGGFANTRVDMVKYRPVDNLLIAASHGRGIYTSLLPTTVTSVSPVANTKGFIQYVSASTQQLLVKTGNLPGVKTITIHLYDFNGRLVKNTRTAYNTSTIPISDLPGGNYVVKIFGDAKQTFIQQLVK